jgi:C1A family cysteine protease
MKTAAFIFAIVAVAAARSLTDLQTQWADFKLENNRFYGSAQEEARRFEIFCDNVREADRLNAHDKGATFGVTQFSDLTLDEFVERHTGFRSDGSALARMAPNAPPTVISGTAPAAWDWRDHGAVNAVKNQGSCGSCWAFSTVAGLEGQDVVDQSASLPSLSEQELVDCDKQSSGCNGGLMHLALEYLVNGHDGQIDTESSYPYHARGGSCSASSHDVGMKGIKGYSLWCNLFDDPSKKCDEAEMLENSATLGPLMIALNANPLMSYSHGILDGDYRGHPNHGVAIVGWGTESGKDFWIVRNSWGASWGEHGYFRIVRGKGECEMNTYVCAATF